MMATAWSVDQTRILSKTEVQTVISDVKRRAKRSVNSHQNLVIFRLATGCGLRVSEICKLRMRDVRVGVPNKQYISIIKSVGKGNKARRVPLWWDAGTLADLEAWKTRRIEQGADANGPFVCSQSTTTLGNALTRGNARRRFRDACKVLGPERLETGGSAPGGRHDGLSIHTGRHTFVSHALAAGRSLAEVQAAAGHANISITSIYTHIAVEDDGSIGNIFD